MPNFSPRSTREVGERRIKSLTQLATVVAIAGAVGLTAFVGHEYKGKTAVASSTPTTTPITSAPATTTPSDDEVTGTTGSSSSQTQTSPPTTVPAPAPVQTTTPTTSRPVTVSGAS